MRLTHVAGDQLLRDIGGCSPLRCSVRCVGWEHQVPEGRVHQPLGHWGRLLPPLGIQSVVWGVNPNYPKVVSPTFGGELYQRTIPNVAEELVPRNNAYPYIARVSELLLCLCLCLCVCVCSLHHEY